MRKSLLAGAAVVGLSFGMLGAAVAQTLPPAPTQGKLVTQLNAGNASAFDNNSAGPAEEKGPIANPTPGTMVIRLNARIEADVAAVWSDLNQVGGNKLYPYQFLQFMRLYPAMDGVAANGLRYGGSIELRQNYNGTLPGSTGSSGGSSYLGKQTVYVRREFVYLAGEQWGYFRFGQADGVIGVFDGGGKTTGVFLSPTGTIVGGDLEATPGNAWMTPYFGAQSGNEYGTLKAVYLSPQFAGFDIGLQFNPNAFNGYGGSCASAAAGFTCSNLSSTTTPSSAPGARAKDIYAAGIRYTGSFSGAKMFAYGVYMGSSHVDYNGSAAAARTAIGAPAGSTYTGQFDDMSLGMFGANIGFGGIDVFGNVMVGDYNGVLALKPSGGSNALGWGAGARYAAGPYTVGFLYSQYDSQGDVALTGVSQRHESVIYVAATYALAPGMTLFADYGYSARHQGDYNFATGAHDTAYNSIHTQGLLFGTNLAW